MMDKVAIISIIYEEPEWSETERCIDSCCIPTFFVNRKGVGSLAKAINSGFRQWGNGYEYIWFVTNITFSKDCLKKLMEEMDRTKFAGITPAFQSDHLFCRPKCDFLGTCEAPFIEFTAPIVRSDVFGFVPLDENMPYWGHDLDWGYRVYQAGHKVGVFHGETLGHSYIRNNLPRHGVTRKRWQLRKQTNAQTVKALEKKYGPAWRRVTGVQIPL